MDPDFHRDDGVGGVERREVLSFRRKSESIVVDPGFHRDRRSLDRRHNGAQEPDHYLVHTMQNDRSSTVFFVIMSYSSI
jgi:hypothetical protein